MVMGWMRHPQIVAEQEGKAVVAAIAFADHEVDDIGGKSGVAERLIGPVLGQVIETHERHPAEFARVVGRQRGVIHNLSRRCPQPVVIHISQLRPCG